MEKLNMHTSDMVNANIEKIGRLFPNCLTERLNDKGRLEKAIDFDILKQELSKEILEGFQERYQFSWPDKKKAILQANAPIAKCFRPMFDRSKDFFHTENIYIEGDNLDAIKLLRETYLHSVDIIYIDPPYNTGNNLIYHNDFHQSASEYLSVSGQFDSEGNRLVNNPISNGRFHTTWLNMIYPRLKIAKDLLSPDGVIVLTIDDYEIETITMVMNEIFGEENRLATIIIKNNPSGRSTVSGAAISHEYALFYGGSNTVRLGRLPRNEKQIARYKEEDDEGKFEWVNFRKHGGYKEDAPTMCYPIYIKKDGTSFRLPRMIWNPSKGDYDVFDEVMEDELVSYPIDERGRHRRWKWGLERAIKEVDHMTVRLDRDKVPSIYIKSRMKEDGMLPLTVWDDTKYSSTEYGTNLLSGIFGDKVFDYPKSLYAVVDCLRIASDKKDALILDFFSGSATTAHAVMEMNSEDKGSRRFIMVQVPETTEGNDVAISLGFHTICEVGEERIRRVGSSLLESKNNEASELFDSCSFDKTTLDTGFRVFKLDTSNMEDVYYKPEEFSELQLFEDNVKPDRTPEDLLFQVMLECNLPLSAKIEKKTIAGKEVFNVNEGYLIACFDKDVNEQVITEVAKQQPYYFVMRDSSLSSDNVADNFEQIFNAYSKDTIRKIL